jgi:ribosome-binding ATPase YchF (GTP1/OBG family)
LEKHFIRAETIRWDQLLEAGSETNARAKGTLRLEGKDYIVQDGDVMHIRHSG